MQKCNKENLADPHTRKRFVSYRQASEVYGIGMTRIQEYAKKAGATYKIGSKVLVNIDIFEAFLSQYRIPGEFENIARKYL